MLLQQVEQYAAYVGDAIVNENIDTGNRTDILLQRKNIGKTLCREFLPKWHYSFSVLDAMSIPNNEEDINTVYFPNLGGPRTREFGNADVQSRITDRLLIERGAKG